MEWVSVVFAAHAGDSTQFNIHPPGGIAEGAARIGSGPPGAGAVTGPAPGAHPRFGR